MAGGYAYPPGEECLQSPFNAAEARLYAHCFPMEHGGANSFAEALEEDSECGQLARQFLHDPNLVPVQHIAKGLQVYFLPSPRPVARASALFRLSSPSHPHSTI